MAHFLRMMRCGNGLLLLRAAVAAKLCRVGEFLSAFATVDHGYFLSLARAAPGQFGLMRQILKKVPEQLNFEI